MAVRDDFAAGEVLAAADLNDTFASKLPYSYGTATPSTSVDGFLWYDENDTPPTPKFWDGSAFQNVAPAGGLALIASEDFSAVSSVSLNGCFSATYENYRVTVHATGSANAYVNLRFRVSGVDATTNYFSGGMFVSYSGSVTSSDSRNAANAAFVGFTNSAIAFSTFDVLRPFEAAATGHLGNSSQTTIGAFYNGLHTTATSYDGMTLFPASGTFTGTVRVYGYKD